MKQAGPFRTENLQKCHVEIQANTAIKKGVSSMYAEDKQTKLIKTCLGIGE